VEEPGSAKNATWSQGRSPDTNSQTAEQRKQRAGWIKKMSKNEQKYLNEEPKKDDASHSKR
jgi:hypothetical protein